MRLNKRQAQAYREMAAKASQIFIIAMDDHYLELLAELKNDDEAVEVLILTPKLSPVPMKYVKYTSIRGNYITRFRKRVYYGGKTMTRIEHVRETLRDMDMAREDLEIMEHCPNAFGAGDIVETDSFFMYDDTGRNVKRTGCRGLTCYECWHKSIDVGPLN